MMFGPGSVCAAAPVIKLWPSAAAPANKNPRLVRPSPAQHWSLIGIAPWTRLTLSLLESGFANQLARILALTRKLFLKFAGTVENWNEAEVDQPRLAKLRIVSDRADVPIEGIHNVRRRSTRRHKREKHGSKVWKPELRQRRHVGKQRRALVRVDGERDD